MKTLLALVVPAAGVLAALAALNNGVGMALLALAATGVAFWRFALR
jgi:hypothetical protein